MVNYSFRPITKSDLPMFKNWLDQPHLNGWWGDSGTEARLAFDAPQYNDQPIDARAIDTFLGEPEFLGKGHGVGYIAARLSELRRHYPAVVVDPDPANTRAIAAYARAGFRPVRVCPCEDGDPVQVMINP